MTFISEKEFQASLKHIQNKVSRERKPNHRTLTDIDIAFARIFCLSSQMKIAVNELDTLLNQTKENS